MSNQTPVTIQFYNSIFGDWPNAAGARCRDRCRFIMGPNDYRHADAVVFHLPTIEHLEYIDKPDGQLWVGWSMESTVNYPIMVDPIRMSRFDLQMNYRRDADIWVPYILMPGTIHPFPSSPEKPEASPVVHFQSNSHDRCGRTGYAAELMKYVKIDSYGTVLNNKTLSDNDRVKGMPYDVVGRYKFALAFENSIAHDYVSDKFFKVLIAGTVPVYLGTETVAELAPGDDCYIDAGDFASPRELARHLNHLNENDDVYAGYHRWRHRPLPASFQTHLDRLSTSMPDRLHDSVRTALAARAA